MSTGNLNGFPFTAIYGMEDSKKAMLCSAVNPRIRTVLIRGCSGSAKTSLSRALSALVSKKIVNLPLNVTEDQLFGGMDIDATLREGRPIVQKGILHRANGKILYVDDINLLDQKIAATLIDCILNGRVVLEREGVSAEYDCETTLIATMNSLEAEMSPHLTDRFDLCAYSVFPEDEVGRAEVLRRNIEYQNNVVAFADMYREEEDQLRSKIKKARDILPITKISEDLLGVIVELTVKISADGLRGDLALVNASMALAALNGRDEVMRKDVEEAAIICLAHRRNSSPNPPERQEQQEQEKQEQERERQEQQEQEKQEQEKGQDNKGHVNQGSPKQEENSNTSEDLSPSQTAEDILFEVGEQFKVIDYLYGVRNKADSTSSRKGQRMLAESFDMTGRYINSRYPAGKARDIAFDATVRAAAPYQRSRGRGDLAISIHSQDIREKVRVRKSGCTILFLVDASGSLGVRKRMSAVKGAVLSMLRDSYIKRDKIGLMAFRRDSAEMILPPTRSAEYGYRKLVDLPTGGKTPLAEALVSASNVMTSYSRSHPGESCYIAIITDGRANVPLNQGSDANEEVIKLASKMSIPQVKWIVIDASSGYFRFDNAEKLAMELEGSYFRLEDLNSDSLAEGVRVIIR